jgi:hypothetical protein
MHCVTLYSNHALIGMIGVVHLCNEVASVLMKKYCGSWSLELLTLFVHSYSRKICEKNITTLAFGCCDNMYLKFYGMLIN